MRLTCSTESPVPNTEVQNEELEKLSVVELTQPPYLKGVPRILLVHGTMDRAGSFRRMARHLEQYQVISYDRRGYGDSKALNPDGSQMKLSWQIHLADLMEIISQAPTVVFGHSYGGTLSLLAAERHCANLLGLVTFESPFPWVEKWAKWPHYSLDPSKDIDPEWAGLEVANFMIEMIGESTWKRLPAGVKEKRISEGITMVSEMSSLAHLDPILDPAKIDVPLLVARSELAPIRHKEISDYLIANVAHAWFEIVPDTGHGIHLQRPERAAELIKELIIKAGLGE